MPTAAGIDLPRYRVAVPWIGPILGHAVAANGEPGPRIALAGAASPALGPAIAAAFVPVVPDPSKDRYLPADAHGIPSDVGSVAWVQDVDCDEDLWFRIAASEHLLRGGFAGVLLVLVYDQSDLGEHPYAVTWGEHIAALREPAQTAGVAARPMPELAGTTCRVNGLPVELRDAIVRRLDALLARTATKDLRVALLELRKGATQAPPAAGAPAPRAPDFPHEILFALASCQFPCGIFDRTVAEAAYRRLACRLETRDAAPECLLLVGDQVYVDSTAGLFDPATKAHRYIVPYEKLFRSDATRDVLRRLPAYMLLDDHEIEDNWEPIGNGMRSDWNLAQGRRSYFRFQRRAGPARVEPRFDSTDPVWFEFERNGFPFFMADTRTERTARSAATVEQARIMSHTQFGALLNWLEKQRRDIPKFVTTPSILLPRHRRALQNGHSASALRSDGWDGYPDSFGRLLAFLAAKEIPNVVFLSGDEHLSCVARARVTELETGKSVLIHSIHSSGLHAPFPFANAVSEDFASDETFCFELPVEFGPIGFGPRPPGGKYACEVTTRCYVPGDGFALLRCWRDAGVWRMDCEFDRDPASRPNIALTEVALAG